MEMEIQQEVPWSVPGPLVPTNGEKPGAVEVWGEGVGIGGSSQDLDPPFISAMKFGHLQGERCPA